MHVPEGDVDFRNFVPFLLQQEIPPNQIGSTLRFSFRTTDDLAAKVHHVLKDWKMKYGGRLITRLHSDQGAATKGKRTWKVCSRGAQFLRSFFTSGVYNMLVFI